MRPSISPRRDDPAERDEEAWGYWAAKFRAAGLDPAVHIVNGNKKDNFWMMGETGPCGPCSELHVDLTPAGDTRGALVNKGTAECIEIWNLVFIQFNANPDGTFIAAARAACRYRHGLRARRFHHPRDKGLHRFRQRENLQLRDGYLPPHL